jgi:hypothetical protein
LLFSYIPIRAGQASNLQHKTKDEMVRWAKQFWTRLDSWGIRS